LYLNPLFTHIPNTDDSLIHLITTSPIPLLSLLFSPSQYSPFGLSYQTLSVSIFIFMTTTLEIFSMNLYFVKMF
jgi:hypothetical protein